MKGDSTRMSLIFRVQTFRDGPAWGDFVDIYGPLIFRHAKFSGIKDADAADFTQEVLQQVMRSIPQFNPKVGRFRQWLYGVCRNVLGHFRRKLFLQVTGSGDSAVQETLQQAPADSLESQWDQDYKKQLFLWAAEKVRPTVLESTWQAFWRTAIDGNAPQCVADELGISVGSVYVARNRIIQQLKRVIEEIDEFE